MVLGRFTTLLILPLFSLSNLFAQQPSAVTANDVAIEMLNVDGPSIFWHVRAGSPQWVLLYQFKRLQDWQRPAELPEEASAIKFSLTKEGDVVKMVVSVYFGSFEKLDTPRSLEGVPEKTAGTYFARINEIVAIQGLKEFGIEPFSLKVVPEKTPTGELPGVINKTTAMEVTRLEEALETYHLTLTNRSPKNVVAINVYMPEKDGRSSIFAEGTPSHPAVASGQTFETQFSTPGRGVRETSRPETQQLQKPVIVIGTILFEDFTYEGEAEIVSYYVGSRRGRKIQITRLLTLINAALKSPAQDPASLIADLRAKTNELDETPDAAVVDELAMNLPTINAKGRSELKSGLRGGLHSGKEMMLAELREYERNRATGRESGESWLRRIKARFEEAASEREVMDAARFTP